MLFILVTSGNARVDWQIAVAKSIAEATIQFDTRSAAYQNAIVDATRDYVFHNSCRMYPSPRVESESVYVACTLQKLEWERRNLDSESDILFFTSLSLKRNFR